MQKRMIVPDRLKSLHDNWHYSPGVLVGDTLYISGAIGIRADGVIPRSAEAQYELCFENMLAVLEEAGVSAGDVVSAVVYLTNIDTLDTVDAVWQEFFTDPQAYPSRAVVGVSALVLGIQLEISAIAIKD